MKQHFDDVKSTTINTNINPKFRVRDPWLPWFLVNNGKKVRESNRTANMLYHNPFPCDWLLIGILRAKGTWSLILMDACSAGVCSSLPRSHRHILSMEITIIIIIRIIDCRKWKSIWIAGTFNCNLFQTIAHNQPPPPSGEMNYIIFVAPLRLTWPRIPESKKCVFNQDLLPLIWKAFVSALPTYQSILRSRRHV